MATIEKTFYRKDFTAKFTNKDGYFSFTGDFDRASGAVGDELSKSDPQFETLNKMHLANANTGAPMYAVENGHYNLEKSGLASLANYWRTTPEKIAELIKGSTEYGAYSQQMDETSRNRLNKLLEKMPEEVKSADLFPIKADDLSKNGALKLLSDNSDLWVTQVITKLKKMNGDKPIDPYGKLAADLKSAGVVKSFASIGSISFRQDLSLLNPELLLKAISTEKDKDRSNFGISSELMSVNKVLVKCVAAEERKVIKSLAEQMAGDWEKDKDAALSLATILPEKTASFDVNNVSSDIKITALAKNLDCSIDDIVPSQSVDGVYSAQGKQFAVLTGDEAENEFKSTVKNSLWAFNPDFLAKFLPLDAPEIKAIQEVKYEDSNKIFEKLLGNNLEDLCEAAEKADGRGHFMNSYDGVEKKTSVEGEDFYIYQDFYPSCEKKKVKKNAP